MSLPPDKPLVEIRARVAKDDFDYLFRELCAGEYGIQQQIISTLFNEFIQIIRTLKLEPYNVNPNTPDRIKRILRTLSVVWARSFIHRGTDGRSD